MKELDSEHHSFELGDKGKSLAEFYSQEQVRQNHFPKRQRQNPMMNSYDRTQINQIVNKSKNMKHHTKHQSVVQLPGTRLQPNTTLILNISNNFNSSQLESHLSPQDMSYQRQDKRSLLDNRVSNSKFKINMNSSTQSDRGNVDRMKQLIKRHRTSSQQQNTRNHSQMNSSGNRGRKSTPGGILIGETSTMSRHKGNKEFV